MDIKNLRKAIACSAELIELETHALMLRKKFKKGLEQLLAKEIVKGGAYVSRSGKVYPDSD